MGLVTRTENATCLIGRRERGWPTKIHMIPQMWFPADTSKHFFRDKEKVPVEKLIGRDGVCWIFLIKLIIMLFCINFGFAALHHNSGVMSLGIEDKIADKFAVMNDGPGILGTMLEQNY